MTTNDLQVVINCVHNNLVLRFVLQLSLFSLSSCFRHIECHFDLQKSCLKFVSTESVQDNSMAWVLSEIHVSMRSPSRIKNIFLIGIR